MRVTLPKSSGFTLVELIVVIGVIGILAVALIAIINPRNQLARARDNKRKSDIKLIQTALEIYRADCGTYPDPVSNRLPNPLEDDGCTGSPIVYMQNVPDDPKYNVGYFYCTTQGGSCQAPLGGYSILACLESADDPDRIVPNPSGFGGVCSTNAPAYLRVTNP